jgi:secreted Zn-dependent insulinase-like peptidase
MNHKTIAIEIELSSKGQKRRRKIIQHYLKQIDIDEVWYFCDAQVVQEVKRSIEEAPFIKVHRLADGLNALAHLLLDEKINEPIRLVTA